MDEEVIKYFVCYTHCRECGGDMRLEGQKYIDANNKHVCCLCRMKKDKIFLDKP